MFPGADAACPPKRLIDKKRKKKERFRFCDKSRGSAASGRQRAGEMAYALNEGILVNKDNRLMGDEVDERISCWEDLAGWVLGLTWQ